MKEKIVIFHNFMDNIGGAEFVNLILARELNADIYTTNIDKEKIRKMGFKDIKIHSIGKVPVQAPLRQQLALLKFKNLDLKSKYDFFIIAGDWAMSAGVHNKPNIWYVHAPMRELWDLYEFTKQKIVPFYARGIFDLWVNYNRNLIKKYIKNIDKIVCNSNNTRNRIKKYLHRDAIVINPPTETSKFCYKKNGDFWLSVNRLLKPKRIELQMKAFAKLPNEKLVIIGSYEKSSHFLKYVSFINKIKPKNVEIRSWIDEHELRELYANCKGFITTAHDEDFGMTAVEAMASGKPVIAPNEGGYKETVINKKTGLLINNIDENNLAEAIKEIGKNPKKYKSACIKQAKKFDTKVFIRKIRRAINFC
jgi:glycosyltransferase involved in cell wall biosynthesis